MTDNPEVHQVFITSSCPRATIPAKLPTVLHRRWHCHHDRPEGQAALDDNGKTYTQS